MAMNGRFEAAALGIFCAAVLDSLDGRVARMTHTQSAFGEQMDSLSRHGQLRRRAGLDRLHVGAQGLGRFGWLAAFVYCAAAALRLARFNVNIGVVDKRFFQGLPSPAAAALVMGLIWVMDDAGFKACREGRLAGVDGFRRHAVRWVVDGHQCTVLQLQGVGGSRTVPFAVIVAIVLVIAVINIDPPIVLFALFCLYGISGYVVYVCTARPRAGRPA